MGTGWLGRASRRVHRVMHRGGDRKETDGLRGEDECLKMYTRLSCVVVFDRDY